jgi:hypothetical protein
LKKSDHSNGTDEIFHVDISYGSGSVLELKPEPLVLDIDLKMIVDNFSNTQLLPWNTFDWVQEKVR